MITFSAFKKLLFLLPALFFLVLLSSYSSISFAQSVPCQVNTRNEGLITSPLIDAGSKFGNPTGNCIIDPKAKIPQEQARIKVHSYEELFTQFYTNNKFVGASNKVAGVPPSTLSGKKVYYHTGDLNITSLTSSASTSGNVGMIFIDGNLFINGNINYAPTDPESGVVFIVKGNIYIHPDVSTIHGVLVSDGEICTAYDTVTITCNNLVLTSSALTVNGSLVSLNSNKPIKFKRTLSDNNFAAEVINAQPKFLVILKGIFSQALTYYSEDTDFGEDLTRVGTIAFQSASFRISGTAYIDWNSNTIMDSGEGGKQNITVYLYKADGNNNKTGAVLQTVVTPANGAFSFTNIASGNYFIEYSFPADEASNLVASGPTTYVVTIDRGSPTAVRNFGIKYIVPPGQNPWFIETINQIVGTINI